MKMTNFVPKLNDNEKDSLYNSTHINIANKL